MINKSNDTFRAGRYIRQDSGYRAFMPVSLPLADPVQMDDTLVRLLSDADRALGRLDGVASVLPNPDLFVAMYVRHEAVLSSQIEGTQSSLEDVLEYEVDEKGKAYPKDIDEVVNYVRAMNHGLKRLKELPLCLRLIKEIHHVLLTNVRGGERNPGEFRSTQNWIGPAGSALSDAAYVPPPPHEVQSLMGNLELFLHDKTTLPVLIHCGLAHAQFETIHPFLDGNGRIGRLLITLMLCEQDVLERPLLYLSHYFKAHRTTYYEHLMAIRHHGNWEGWLKFFLKGIYKVSRSATETARKILNLREHHRTNLVEGFSASTNGLKLLDYLYEKPVFSVRMAQKHLDCTYTTAAKVVGQLEKAGLVVEITGQQRNRLYRYSPYLELFKQ